MAFNKIKQLKMTVLPDFFLDVIIDPRMSYEQLIQEIQTVYSRGGGNLLGPEARFIPGGNGGNVAKTLAGLGVSTAFICETSKLGKQLIEFFMHPLGVQTFISISGNMASSIILENPGVSFDKTSCKDPKLMAFYIKATKDRQRKEKCFLYQSLTYCCNVLL